MSLCDVCPQDQAKRPCENCGEVRMEMHASAMRAEQQWDLRHRHMNGLEDGFELVFVPERELSIQDIDPEQVRKHGIEVGDYILVNEIRITA